jgi:hypothetical protein
MSCVRAEERERARERERKGEAEEERERERQRQRQRQRERERQRDRERETETERESERTRGMHGERVFATPTRKQARRSSSEITTSTCRHQTSATSATCTPSRCAAFPSQSSRHCLLACRCVSCRVHCLLACPPPPPTRHATTTTTRRPPTHLWHRPNAALCHHQPAVLAVLAVVPDEHAHLGRMALRVQLRPELPRRHGLLQPWLGGPGLLAPLGFVGSGSGGALGVAGRGGGSGGGSSAAVCRVRPVSVLMVLLALAFAAAPFLAARGLAAGLRTVCRGVAARRCCCGC